MAETFNPQQSINIPCFELFFWFNHFQELTMHIQWMSEIRTSLVFEQLGSIQFLDTYSQKVRR